MAEEVFGIRMEKVNDHTSDSKYAIIGYFAEKQAKQYRSVARAAAEADPESAMEVPTQQATPQQSPTNKAPEPARSAKSYTLSNILAESTADQWLLALIAFLLFINLICRS